MDSVLIGKHPGSRGLALRLLIGWPVLVLGATILARRLPERDGAFAGVALV